MSEQEQREDVASSPAVVPDLFEEGPSAKESTVREVGVTTNVIPAQTITAVPDSRELTSLTQKSLFEHTKQQQQLFVLEAKQDRNLIVLKHNNKVLKTEETSSCLKRSHSPDSINKDRQHRAIKTLKSQVAPKQFGVKEPEGAKGGLLSPSRPAGQPMFLPFSIANCPQGISGIPFVQVDPTSGVQIPSMLMSPKTTNAPTSSLQNTASMQWPYYPQSGKIFIFVIGRFTV